MTAQRVLLLCPSAGRGGGIERFSDAVADALSRRKVAFDRVNLSTPGAPEGRLERYAAMRRDAALIVDSSSGPLRLVVMHRSLLPMALWLIRRRPDVSGISVVLHGIDIWGGRPKPELLLLRHRMVRPVAVSAFSAGSLGARAQATILHPTISEAWYRQLLEANATGEPQQNSCLNVVTTFRLSEWRQKGLPELIRACELLNYSYRLVVCGSGDPDPALLGAVSARPEVELRPNLSDADLARELARADVVVLATRLRAGQRPSGEGFGLVLAEGQLAGAATVAPAYGGGHDTYVEDVTGYAPVNESPEALASVLGNLTDPAARSRVAEAGHDMAKKYFHPERQADRILARLL